MKTSYLFLIALFLLVFLAGCKGSTDLTNTDLLISGKWNWIKSEGWPGSTTPEQAGYTKQISFNVYGTYREYRNGALYLESSYRIEAKDIDEDNSFESVIVIDIPNPDIIHRQSFIVESFQNDTLLLREVFCADCRDMNYYTKIR